MTTQSEAFKLFSSWFADANKHEIKNPNAMALSTVADDGQPDVRVVFLQSFDEKGFVFCTHYTSKKSHDLEINPKASLCFYWKSLDKQVRVAGAISKISEKESDDIFDSLPRINKIAAWASQQSTPMKNSFELEIKFAEYALKFNIAKIPRPAHWGGYRLTPTRIEFGEDKPTGLHTRRLFTKNNSDWVSEYIFP